MSHPEIDDRARRAQKRPGVFERAVEAATRHHAENDHRRLRLVSDASRKAAATHTGKLGDDSPEPRKPLSARGRTADLDLANASTQETPGLTRNALESLRLPLTPLEPALADRVIVGQSFRTVVPATLTPDLATMLAAHPQFAGRTVTTTPHREAAIGEGRNAKQSLFLSDSGATNALIGSVAAPMAAAPLDQPIQPVPALTAFARDAGSEWRLALSRTSSAGREPSVWGGGSRNQGQNKDPRSALPGDEMSRGLKLSTTDDGSIMKALTELLSSDNVHSQALGLANNRSSSDAVTRVRQEHPAIDSGRPGKNTRGLQASLSGAHTIAPVVADLDRPSGQENRQPINSRFDLNADRGDDWSDRERSGSEPGTNASARQELAAAADELERLRATVRRTIDDLERARGAVNSALPALPPSRGTFRIS